MVRLFKKIKGALAQLTKLRSTRQPNPPIPAGQETASNAPETPVQPVTALAIAAPEPVANAPVFLDQPETHHTPVSSPVIMKRASHVKISRIKRRTRRPQPVIRKSVGDDVDDNENTTSRQVYVVSRKLVSQKRKRKLGVVKPKFRVAREA